MLPFLNFPETSQTEDNSVNKLRFKILAALSLLLAALSLLLLGQLVFAADNSAQSVRCAVAAQAKMVFDDPAVQEFFNGKGLIVTATEANTAEMVKAATSNNPPDCLLLSSAAGLVQLQAKGVKPKATDMVFKTYLVAIVRGSLIGPFVTMGIVEEEDDEHGSYLVFADFPLLANAALDGKKWSELAGFSALDSTAAKQISRLRTIKLFSTSPKANSGLFFGIILGTVRSVEGHRDVDTLTVARWNLQNPRTKLAVGQEVKNYFSSTGQKLPTASELFNQFLTGRSTDVVFIYEAQLIEFAQGLAWQASQGSQEAATYLEKLREIARIVYISPTFDANHPVVGLSDAGIAVVEAMKDQAFRDLAWQRHGFRPFALGGEVDISHLSATLPGIATAPPVVFQLPDDEVQTLVKETLTGN